MGYEKMPRGGRGRMTETWRREPTGYVRRRRRIPMGAINLSQVMSPQPMQMTTTAIAPRTLEEEPLPQIMPAPDPVIQEAVQEPIPTAPAPAPTPVVAPTTVAEQPAPEPFMSCVSPAIWDPIEKRCRVVQVAPAPTTELVRTVEAMTQEEVVAPTAVPSVPIPEPEPAVCPPGYTGLPPDCVLVPVPEDEARAEEAEFERAIVDAAEVVDITPEEPTLAVAPAPVVAPQITVAPRIAVQPSPAAKALTEIPLRPAAPARPALVPKPKPKLAGVHYAMIFGGGAVALYLLFGGKKKR